MEELNLRLNKNQGKWDWDMLADFDETLLQDVGFEEGELKMMFGLNNAENVEVDMERMNVITVEAPEAPRLKERMAFYCETIDDYKKIEEFFKKVGAELDIDKLIGML